MDSATTLTLAASLYATGTIAWAYKTRRWTEEARQVIAVKFANADQRAVAIGLHIGAFVWIIGWPIIMPWIAFWVAVHLARRS